MYQTNYYIKKKSGEKEIKSVQACFNSLSKPRGGKVILVIPDHYVHPGAEVIHSDKDIKKYVDGIKNAGFPLKYWGRVKYTKKSEFHVNSDFFKEVKSYIKIELKANDYKNRTALLLVLTLLRYLYETPFQRIVTTYLNLKEKLPKAEDAELLALMHFGNAKPSFPGGHSAGGFVQSYLPKNKDVKRMVKYGVNSVNYFSTPFVDGPDYDINNVFLNKFSNVIILTHEQIYKKFHYEREEDIPFSWV